MSETHQERAERLPYLPEAFDKCPQCGSDQIGGCRCPVGEMFCLCCKYEWRVGILYWKTGAETEMNKGDKENACGN